MIRVVKVNRLRTPEARASVCYCGRRFAGWDKSPWCNPFSKYNHVDPMGAFRDHVDRMPVAEKERWLTDLWEACEHGAKPLGCWCCDAIAGDGQPVVCHAQILAEMLLERFASTEVGKA